jgi:hypothetical protein
MSAGFPPYTLRSVLRAHSRTSRRNYSSRDYSSRTLNRASTHPRTRHQSLLYHPTSATDQQATQGLWQYTTLSNRRVGDRRWRGCCGARDGPPAGRNVHYIGIRRRQEHAEASSEDGGCSRAALMTDQAARGSRSLTGRAFLTFLVALVSSPCTAGYSQCLHNGGGVLRCSVSSGQINQRAGASALASCSAGDEDVCRTACAQTRDPQICDTWFAIKCPEEPSVCQSACHLAHDRVACRGACEAGDQAACIDYFQMTQ